MCIRDSIIRERRREDKCGRKNGAKSKFTAKDSENIYAVKTGAHGGQFGDKDKKDSASVNSLF